MTNWWCARFRRWWTLLTQPYLSRMNANDLSRCRTIRIYHILSVGWLHRLAKIKNTRSKTGHYTQNSSRFKVTHANIHGSHYPFSKRMSLTILFPTRHSLCHFVGGLQLMDWKRQNKRHSEIQKLIQNNKPKQINSNASMSPFTGTRKMIRCCPLQSVVAEGIHRTSDEDCLSTSAQGWKKTMGCGREEHGRRT